MRRSAGTGPTPGSSCRRSAPPILANSSRRSRWLRRLAFAAVVLAALSTPLLGAQGSPSRQSSPGPKETGSAVGVSFDVETVEDLALFFAVESVRRMRVPLTIRLLQLKFGRIDKQEMIEEFQVNPPQSDANGVVYPFGDKNALSFVFDPETRSMTCWERVVKRYGSTGSFGLTGPELAAALNAVTSRDKDRGGADFAYDPIRDALSLRREYLHPPADRNRFFEEISRLVATEAKWESKRYLDEVEPIAESRLRPGSAAAVREGFGATLVLRHFSAEPAESQQWVERYLRAWDRPPGGLTPLLVSDRELLVDQMMHAYIHFYGARNGPHGSAGVDVIYQLIAPDGREVFEQSDVPIWRGPAQPTDHVQLGVKDLSFALDGQEPRGTYRLEAHVCDAATNRCIELVHPFVLRSR